MFLLEANPITWAEAFNNVGIAVAIALAIVGIVYVLVRY